MKTKIFVYNNSDSFSDFIEFVRDNQNFGKLSILVPENKDYLIVSISRIDV